MPVVQPRNAAPRAPVAPQVSACGSADSKRHAPSAPDACRMRVRRPAARACRALASAGLVRRVRVRLLGLFLRLVADPRATGGTDRATDDRAGRSRHRAADQRARDRATGAAHARTGLVVAVHRLAGDRAADRADDAADRGPDRPADHHADAGPASAPAPAPTASVACSSFSGAVPSASTRSCDRA